jgi:hypothetical protein
VLAQRSQPRLQLRSAVARGELDSVELREAEYSDPGNKRARLFSAAGSAGETRVALRLAVAWRIVGEREAGRAMELPGMLGRNLRVHLGAMPTERLISVALKPR